MRKEMTVVGIGFKKSGIGKKSGKPYEFTDYCFTYDSDDVIGSKAETIFLSPDIIGDRKISIGDVLDVVCHQYNFKTQIDAIL